MATTTLAHAPPVPRTPTPARDVGLDTLRVVGVLAIVAGHTWTDGLVRDATFPWHVPVFFVVTGYLWRSRPWDREVLARSAGLLRPYVLWLAVAATATAALVAAGHTAPVPLDDLLRGGVALGGPLTAFWFVTALFAACTLYAVADRAGPAGRAVAVAVAAAAVPAAPELATLPLSVGVALPALLFVEAGRLLRLVLDGWGTVPSWAVVTAAAVLGGFAGLAGTATTPAVDLKVGAFGGVAGISTALAVSAALVVLARAIRSGIGRRTAEVVTLAATALLPVVLLHPVLLTLPAWNDGQRFVVAVAAPLVLALLLRRTRLAGWALGR